MRDFGRREEENEGRKVREKAAGRNRLPDQWSEKDTDAAATAETAHSRSHSSLRPYRTDLYHLLLQPFSELFRRIKQDGVLCNVLVRHDGKRVQQGDLKRKAGDLMSLEFATGSFPSEYYLIIWLRFIDSTNQM